MAHNDEAVIASLTNEIQQLEQQLQDSVKQRQTAELYGLDQRLEAQRLVKKISEMRDNMETDRRDGTVNSELTAVDKLQKEVQEIQGLVSGNSGSSRDRNDKPCKSSITINGCFTYALGWLKKTRF